MELTLYINALDEYLKADSVVDYDHKAIQELANTLYQKANNEVDFIGQAYEFVRDRISHSADIQADKITCSASEVLEAGHALLCCV